MMSYQANNSYGYQRPNQMAYNQHQQSGLPAMGSAGVYGSSPIVSFPVPPAAPSVPTSKPYYRCWDNNQKKWFFWEQDSTVTTWEEPASHITLLDHATGAIVEREPVVSRPVPVIDVAAAVVAPSYGNARTAMPAMTAKPVMNTVSHSQPMAAKAATTINPNYSAGVSRYTQQSSTGGVSATEKARLEEADRLIAEQLQKQLSMEAEAELFASCPLPGEAAKILTDKKKLVKPGFKSETTDDSKLIADMAQSGFVVKKQKQKKGGK